MNGTRCYGFGRTTASLSVLAASLSVAACTGTSAEDNELYSVENSALNGSLVPSGGPLTRLSQNFTQTNEGLREAETDAYYNTATVGVDGNGNTIRGYFDSVFGLYPNDLAAFRALYQFQGAPSESVTYYYNRGDLGIGREMHCQDFINFSPSFGYIACYVTNFAAGDDNSEFSFGLSSNIAFSNMHAGHAFATVAMVFRTAANSQNRVTFMVFDGNGKLTNKAALDRHAVSFATGQISGTPGTNFNLHIPSNCVACHGGQQYDSGTHSQTGGLFLPFDLDQFEYEEVAGRTRSDQLTAFKHQNEMVRKVAALSPGIGDSIKAQLDKWYANTVFQRPKTEVFENSFDSNAVPTGWVGFESFYRSVVRRSCRTCHIANEFGRTFDLQTSFKSTAGLSVGQICAVQMPHSLQSVREFWQSTAPIELESYLRSAGLTASADQLHGCGPGDVVTLDPPVLQAAVSQL